MAFFLNSSSHLGVSGFLSLHVKKKSKMFASNPLPWDPKITHIKANLGIEMAEIITCLFFLMKITYLRALPHIRRICSNNQTCCMGKMESKKWGKHAKKKKWWFFSFFSLWLPTFLVYLGLKGENQSDVNKNQNLTKFKQASNRNSLLTLLSFPFVLFFSFNFSGFSKKNKKKKCLSGDHGSGEWKQMLQDDKNERRLNRRGMGTT